MDTGDLATALHDVNLVGVDLSPVCDVEETDCAGGSNTELLKISVDRDALNRVVANLDLEELLAGLV